MNDDSDRPITSIEFSRLSKAFFDELERRNDNEVWCGSGVACAKLAKQCIKWGLGPAEFFAGIPGTLGGALAMNAGAFGGETWRHVVSVAVIDRNGVRRERPVTDYSVGYRHVSGKEHNWGDEWFLGALLRFELRPGVSNDDIQYARGISPAWDRED